MLPEDEWWFNLRTQKVEQGPGDPNSERFGPYATEEEARGVLDRVHARNEEWDQDDQVNPAHTGEIADGGAESGE